VIPPPRSGSPVDPAGPSLVRSFAACAIATVWLLGFCGLFFAQTLPNSGLARVDILATLPEAVAAHFVWTADSHPRFLTQRVDIAFTALGIVCGAWGYGRLVLRCLNVRLPRFSAAGLALAGGLGLSAWSLITLGLGLAGVLSQPLFIALLAGGFLGGVFVDRQPNPTNAKSPCGTPREWHWGLPLLILLLVGPFVALMLLGAMLPPTDFDVLEYHLQGPKEFYQGGRVRMLPHNVYTSFPFLTEMLSLSGMVVRGDWYRGALVGQTVLMSFAVFTACGVLALTRQLIERAGLTDGSHRVDRHWSPIDLGGWMAVLILLSTPWVYRISIIAYTEGALACYITLAALVFAMRFNRDSSESSENTPTARWDLLLGLLTGSAAATKYPAVVTAVIPLGVALLWVHQRPTASWKRVFVAGGWYSLGVLLTFGPWLLKNLVETGNPVYPLLWSIFGGVSFDEATNIRWKAAHSPPVWLLERPGEILPDLWGRLWDVAILSDWQSPLLCGLAPLSLLIGRVRRATRGVWIYVLWLFATWCWLTHRIDRFWVPMIPLLAVLGGVGLGGLWLRLRDWSAQSETPGAVVLSGVWGVVLFAVVLFNLGFVSTALCGNNGYLVTERLVRFRARNSSIRRITLPSEVYHLPTPKVLFVGEAAIFHAEFPVQYNTVFDDSLFIEWCFQASPGSTGDGLQLRPGPEVLATLHAKGIQLICVNWREVIRYRLPGSYGFPDEVHPDRFDDLIEAGVLSKDVFGEDCSWTDLSHAEQAEVLLWAPPLRYQWGRYEEPFPYIRVYRVMPRASSDESESASTQ
jgi:hypothetical protein